MRKTLIEARKAKGFSQADTAKRLSISTRQYQRIESGDALGKVTMWDKLEQILGIPQRELRENPSPVYHTPPTHDKEETT